ncbi:MAG: hypothetical protein PHV99_02905 [Candidatus Pacebacteria bacterium]|nr:hypothetical protein [Candidatus Paceibacterota bacterium]
MDSTQSNQGLTLDESIKQVMQTLPPAVRNYLAQGRYTTVAKNMMTKYGLRIDQGGVLERELMLLLLGVETPDDFVQTLRTEATISDENIRSIVREVNEQIFVPLRNEMMRQPAAAGSQASAATPHPATAQGAVPEKFFHLENKLAPRPTQPSVTPTLATPQPVRPAMQPAVVATPSTLAQAIGNALSAKPKVVQPRPAFSNIAPLPPKFVSPHPSLKATEGTAKTFGNQVSPKPSTLLEDHEEPHLELKKPQPPSPATQSFPARPKIEPSIPVNLPGAMPPFPVSDVGVQTSPLQKPTPPTPITPAAIPPVSKSYSTDPYREPIE